MEPARDHAATERMTTVLCCRSRIDAQLARGALEAHGVRAIVLTDDAGGVHPQLALLADGAVRVAVPDHEVRLARDVLAELDAGVHALPSTGDHERIDAPRRGAPLVLVAGALLLVLLAYRTVTMVWPGLG